jgi:hypothetical protein
MPFNILVIYCNYTHPLRPTIKEHTNAFKNYSSHRVFHYNAFCGDVPKLLKTFRPDIIIFQTSFLSQRWSPPLFERLVERMRYLKEHDVPKIAIPQDEFINAKYLCAFINEFKINSVFCLSSSEDWPNIYCDIDREKVRISRVLAGYLDQKSMKKYAKLAGNKKRRIDIGYRAWNAAYWIGKHGRLKVRIAEEFLKKAPQYGFITDISLRDEDTLVGRRWYEFLADCKYGIGVPGGASVLDRDGSIRDRVNAYIKDHPEASFEEISETCLQGYDGTLGLSVITPRHLESCWTRTAQVLIEADYNGILKAGKHYIAVNSDFSNLDDVLKQMKDENLRQKLVECAYRDIVESGRYTYSAFAETVMQDALSTLHGSQARHDLLASMYYLFLYQFYEIKASLFVLVFSLIYGDKFKLHRKKLNLLKVKYKSYKAFFLRIVCS